MKAYTYVIMVDAGSAPNYDLPMTTLAICKPRIRIAAGIGDLVLAFTGSRLGPERHGVRWAGVVSEKIPFADYWADPRFQRKKPDESIVPDNIYRPIEGNLVQVDNNIHDGGNVDTDLSGRYVLLFKESWYFGPTSPLPPESFGLRMTGGRRGHRVADLADAQWKKLKSWLNAQTRVTTAEPIKDRGCRPKPRERC